MTYNEWKVLSKSKELKDWHLTLNFECANPEIAREYKKREQDEKKEFESIMKISDREKREKKLARYLAIHDPEGTERRQREREGR